MAGFPKPEVVRVLSLAGLVLRGAERLRPVISAM